MIAGTRQETGRQGWGSRWVAGAVALVAVIGVAGACDGGDDPGPGETTATATAPATGDAAEALRERNIAEAKATVEAYVAAVSQTANNGYVDWREVLLPFLTGEALKMIESLYLGSETEGIVADGSSRVVDLRVEEYVDESSTGGVEILLRACVDSSAVSLFDLNGAPIPEEPNAESRWRVRYGLVRERVDGDWLISSYESTNVAC